jgi:hypothetical protein
MAGYGVMHRESGRGSRAMPPTKLALAVPCDNDGWLAAHTQQQEMA